MALMTVLLLFGVQSQPEIAAEFNEYRGKLIYYIATLH